MYITELFVFKHMRYSYTRSQWKCCTSPRALYSQFLRLKVLSLLDKRSYGQMSLFKCYTWEDIKNNKNKLFSAENSPLPGPILRLNLEVGLHKITCYLEQKKEKKNYLNNTLHLYNLYPISGGL